MKFILIIMLCVLFSGCGAFVEPSQAEQAMESLGFENVQVDGPHFLFPGFRGCGENDSAMFNAIGTRDNKRVHATVCCGFLFKACTVRF